MRHLVLEDEVPDHLEELIGRMIEETGAAGEIEPRLARRLAIAFWKGERAERIEVALFDAAPKTRMNGYRPEEADPLTTFDLRRFNAVRGQQGQIGREISRCLKELRLLRKEALAAGQRTSVPHERNYTNELSAGTDEPDSGWQKEPEPTAPANDDAAVAWDSRLRLPRTACETNPTNRQHRTHLRTSWPLTGPGCSRRSGPRWTHWSSWTRPSPTRRGSTSSPTRCAGRVCGPRRVGEARAGSALPDQPERGGDFGHQW